MSIEFHDTDILVLGAGLAGVRAAMAALEARPDSRVAVVSVARGPAGSSFANCNNALGMQVHESDAEREAFLRRVLEVAAPGVVDAGLAGIMAEESQARFLDMAALGLRFTREADGSPRRYPACFAPDLGHARVFTGLAQACRCHHHALKGLGGRLLAGLQVRDLVQMEHGGEHRACGALLEDAAGNTLAVKAKAVIMALGGPAALFRHNQAPAGNTGHALGLLARANAALANTRYLQFMWATLPGKRFVPVSRLAEPGALIRTRGGECLRLPEQLAALARQRRTHCPMAHGLEDSGLDAFLGRHLDADGVLEACLPDQGWLRMAPMAHACNGGALIDAHGRTSVPGLYAAGECAAGMHGANRLGGAMVLATQVFGRRAGLAAAHEAREAPEFPGTAFARAVAERIEEADRDAPPSPEVAALIALRLQQAAVFRDPAALRALRAELAGLAESSLAWKDRLCLETARVLAAPDNATASSEGVTADAPVTDGSTWPSRSRMRQSMSPLNEPW